MPTLEQITETVIEIVKKRIDKEVETFNKLVDFTSNSFKNFIKTTQKAGQKLTQFSRRFIKEIDKGIDFFAFGVKRSINLVIDQMKELQPEEPLEKEIVEKPKPSQPPAIVSTDTILIRSVSGNINLDLTNQKAQVIAGKQVAVFIKPSKPVSSLEGFLYFEKISQIELKHTFYLPLIPKAFASSVFAKTYEILSLVFKGPDEQGFFKAILNIPPVVGEYKIGVDINFIDGSKKTAEKIVLVDPEGYIYDELLRGQLRIKGAKISLWVFDESINDYILWSAELYDQKNPQITNETGEYSFLVPEGNYYTKVEHPDYETYQSEAFKVREGEPVHSNIEMELKSFWQRIFQ